MSATETPTSATTSTSVTGAAVPTEDQATRAFSTSIAISGIRCMLAYVVFPWVLPALGVARGVGPGIGLAVGIVAIGFNIASIRRFHASDHRWKWPISALNGAVIVLLSILAVIDLGDLLG
ncbi:MAG: hypothetical protein U5K30_11140 [Acidimicrobiales bacterium]|nr:hypothetical protein [Acidimicrobiales bacterium]